MDILILVCALSIAAPDCQKETAQHMFFAPPSDGSMVNCTREGLLYAAESRLVKSGTYAKIICDAGGRAHRQARNERSAE
jgi:hypothetical protein